MLDLLRRLLRRKEPTPDELLADLLLVAREDDAFRAQVLFLLRSPPAQRAALVNTALHEMELRGEPGSARAAFAILSTEAGARAALQVLEQP